MMRRRSPPQKRIFECTECRTRAPALNRPDRRTSPGHVIEMIAEGQVKRKSNRLEDKL